MDGAVTNVPLPRPVRGSGKPRRKAPKVPEAVRKAALAYKQAYKAVYGVIPSLRWDGTWVRIVGHTEGVKLSRLKVMTTQLQARAG